LIYEVPKADYEINNVVYQFSVGQAVYAKEGTCETFVKATIIAVNEDGTFTVQFEDGTTEIKTENEILIYYDCSGCSNSALPPDSNGSFTELELNICYDPNYLNLK
jgi:hypothetical protein